jgi:hypothetical protein
MKKRETGYEVTQAFSYGYYFIQVIVQKQEHGTVKK